MTDGGPPGLSGPLDPSRRGLNNFNKFLTVIQRDVPRQLERSRKVRAALRLAGRR